MHPRRLLGLGIRFINGFMVDQCTIERDPAGTADALLDPATGELIEPPNPLLYTGKCSFGPTSRAERLEEDAGDAPEQIRTYTLLLPLYDDSGTPVIGFRPGDIARITYTEYEPDIVGEPLIVRDLTNRSLPTYRSLTVQARRRMDRYAV